MMLGIAGRRADFRALHKEGYFLLPSAWDSRGARCLEALGFAGLASSNVSLAWTLGRDDGRVTRDEVLAHLRLLVNATETAVDADFGTGFAADAKELAVNVGLAIDTGIAALSIRDGMGRELHDIRHAAIRIQACRDAIAMSGADVLLVGRSDAFLIGHSSVGATIERLVAYSESGADILCAPGLSEPDDIRAVVEAVEPKPVDVRLMKPGMTAAELGELGVRRISVGDYLAEASWASFERMAQQFIDYGSLPPRICDAA